MWIGSARHINGQQKTLKVFCVLLHPELRGSVPSDALDPLLLPRTLRGALPCNSTPSAASPSLINSALLILAGNRRRGIRKRRSTLRSAQIDSTDAQQNTLVIWKHVPAAVRASTLHTFSYLPVAISELCTCVHEAVLKSSIDLCSMRKKKTHHIGWVFQGQMNHFLNN